MSDLGDRVPLDRHRGIGLREDQFTHERRSRSTSSMLPVDTILNVDGLPMTPVAHVKNKELPKI